MNANEVMKNSINKLTKGLEGESQSKQDGYRETVENMLRLSETKDSTEFLPYVNKMAYDTYNHAEDLKDADASLDKIQYAEGEYKAFEDFREHFNRWLVKQDDTTILKHSVNEEITIREGVELPALDTVEKRIAYAVTQFYLRGYEQDENGDIKQVNVELGERNLSFTYDEFSKLFDIDHMDWLKENN